MLGLFGIALVILSVSSSVGFFSILGVRATLIIAEVIPFLVLAVGVDNVFILVHEMDRQNMLHGPNAANMSTFGATTPLFPSQARNRGQFDPSQSNDDSVDAASVPLDLSVEERVARTLAKMGPSILLSTVTEMVAFVLGAVVPMPAVRNFALYAAGSVFLNAILQVTVFVSAMTLDQRRIEVSIDLPSLGHLNSSTCRRTAWIVSHAYVCLPGSLCWIRLHLPVVSELLGSSSSASTLRSCYDRS